MVSLMILWALGGCGTAEQAVLDPFPSALAAYEAGVLALEDGRPAQAVQALEQAVQADPRSPELQLWLGRARAAAGNAPGAVQAASAALALRSGWGLALYNRACWRVGAGELEAAVVDLEAALRTGEVGALTAGADPDLAALRQDPRFADRVPGASLPVLLEGGPESVFQGSDWTATLFVRHPVGERPEIVWQGASPPGLTLRRVIEDATVEGDEVRSSVAWTWRVGGPFSGAVGPLAVRAGGLTGVTEAVQVRFLAPPDTPPAAGPAPSLPLPQAVLEGLVDGAPVREGSQVRVRVAAGDRVAWTPRPADLVRFEQRDQGQVDWIAWVAESDPETVIKVTRGRQVRFEGTVP